MDRRVALFGSAAGVLALIVDGVYLGIVKSQGSVDDPWRVVFVALLIAVLALVLMLGAARSTAKWAMACLGFGAVGLLTLAVLAGFSIGILLVPSALLAVATAIALIGRGPHRGKATGMAGLGAIIAWAIMFAGFTLLTYLPPGCPSHTGHVEGSVHGSGYVTTFTCENGRLVTRHRS